MDNKTLSAEIRKGLKKSGAKKTRKSGKLPAVIYGHNDPENIAVDEKENDGNIVSSESALIRDLS